MNHTFGYTSFAVRVDNATNITWGGANVIALYVDSTLPQTNGWWYEGGGVFRPTHLVRTSMIRIQDDSLFATTHLDGAIHTRATHADGLVAAGATVHPRVVVENHTPAATSVLVGVRMYDITTSSRSPGVSSESLSITVPGGGAAVSVDVPPLALAMAELWSVARPFTYMLEARVLDASTRTVLDVFNMTVGVRSASFTGPDNRQARTQALVARAHICMFVFGASLCC
jgi:beta-galactosidase